MTTKLPRLIKGGQEKSQRHSKQDYVLPVIPKHTVAIIRVNDKLETHSLRAKVLLDCPAHLDHQALKSRSEGAKEPNLYRFWGSFFWNDHQVIHQAPCIRHLESNDERVEMAKNG